MHAPPETGKTAAGIPPAVVSQKSEQFANQLTSNHTDATPAYQALKLSRLFFLRLATACTVAHLAFGVWR